MNVVMIRGSPVWGPTPSVQWSGAHVPPVTWQLLSLTVPPVWMRALMQSGIVWPPLFVLTQSTASLLDVRGVLLLQLPSGLDFHIPQYFADCKAQDGVFGA